MAQSIITISEMSTEKRNFKSSALSSYTAKIVTIYSDASKFVEKKNRELATILAAIKTEKCYEADGFKSVADYAEQVFGIKRVNAYALATAGEIYSSDKTPESVKALSPSKLVELSKVPVDKVAEAMKAGTISKDSTQKELREFAKIATSKEEKPIVLAEYTARPVQSTIPALEKLFSEPHTIQFFKNAVVDFIQNNNLSIMPVEVIDLKKTVPIDHLDQTKKVIDRTLFITENLSLVLEFYAYRKPVEKSNGKPKFTKEQLLAMLAEFDK